jgi:hypothetical protein
MGTLTEAVTKANMQLHTIQINRETREVRYIPTVVAAAKKHGPSCRCEACSSMHMQRTRDKRMKAMMPGNVDMGNRQPATMGKVKADSALMMKKKKKVKAKLDYGLPKPKVKQVAPGKSKSETLKPSQLIHDKGKVLK